MEKYVVEARNEDGSLNTKYYNPDDPKEFVTGISKDGLFNYYFSHNKDKEFVSFIGVYRFFKSRGLYIRVKYW